MPGAAPFASKGAGFDFSMLGVYPDRVGAVNSSSPHPVDQISSGHFRAGAPGARSLVAFHMVKFRYEWFLFDYKKGFPDRLSRPFKSKAAAEKAREKYPAKQRGGIGVAICQIPVTRPKRKS